MKMTPEVLREVVKYFRAGNRIGPFLLMRKYKITYEAGKHICEHIEKRFPNLWKEFSSNE